MIRLAIAIVLTCCTAASAATVSLTPAPGLNHVWVHDKTHALDFTQVGVDGNWINFGNDPVIDSVYFRDFYTDAATFAFADDAFMGIKVTVTPAPDVYLLLDYFHASEWHVHYEWNHSAFGAMFAGLDYSGLESQSVPEPTSLTALLLLTLLCVTGLSSKKRSKKRRDRESMGFGV